MLRYRLALLVGVSLLSGCTAVGAWVYDDPSFALRSVALHPQDPDAGGSDSLELVFVGCNRNDYELTGDAFATSLAVGGRTVGQGERDRPVHLPVRDTSRFSVMLALPPEGVAADGDRVPFAIAGSSDVLTPIGIRKVDFRLHGRMQRRGETWEWQEEGAGGCRPGLSALPFEFIQPPPPIRDDSRPERPTRTAPSRGTGEQP
jgi:hypothetical protein